MEGPTHAGTRSTDARPISLYDLDRDSLAGLVADVGEPRYRSDQLWHWLYRRTAATFDEMHNIPEALRDRLRSSYAMHTISPRAIATSRDEQADKLLLALSDGQFVETVLMHYTDPADIEQSASAADGEDPEKARRGRHTVCLSTQAGCAMGCTFCATGQMGLVRDLTAGEVVEQAVYGARRLRDTGDRLSNVVFMGMGEPLANFNATIHAIGVLTDPDGFGIGARRITVSTVGLPSAMDRLARTGRKVRLAVSLHAPDDELRSRLVGINHTYPLADVLAACRRYQVSMGRRITFEYVLIDGVNDGVAQARALARAIDGIAAHVNLIPLNPTAGSELKPSPSGSVALFRSALEACGVTATARLRRGIDIDAGCGQLRSRVVAGSMGRSVRQA